MQRVERRRSKAPWPEPVGRIRPMRESDLGMVAQIEYRSHPTPWPTWVFRRGLRLGWSCWTLESEGRVLAYGIMVVRRGWVHIMNVTVSPVVRGHGFGRRMMEHLMREAKRKHAHHAWLEVRPDNTAAIHLYRKLDFRKKAVRKCYYSGPGRRQDAWVMARPL